MAHSEIEMLSSLVELRRDEEDEAGKSLAQAKAVLDAAQQIEDASAERLRGIHEKIEESDALAAADVEGGASIRDISLRADFRRSLIGAFEEAERACEIARKDREAAEACLKSARRALTDAVAKRTAAETMLEKARRAMQKRVEDRQEEESADLAALRAVGGEENV